MATGPLVSFGYFPPFFIYLFIFIFGGERICYLYFEVPTTHRCHRRMVVVDVAADGLATDDDERRRAGLESRSGCDK